MNQQETDYQSSIQNFVEEHPITVTLGVMGLTIFASWKIQEAIISNAVYKANKKSVDYILSQFRYLK